MHFGIDYGSKLAGTTAICYQKDQSLFIEQSKKKEDSDQFLQEHIQKLKPDKIFIDAPLSLPKAYFGEGGSFHFRVCDKETKAMSPMFLGGLTARAIALKNLNGKIDFYEVYPAYFVRTLMSADPNYKKKEKEVNTKITKSIQKLTDYKLPKIIDNYHALDAVLCWISGQRYAQNIHLSIGDKKEGQIIV